ncbi:sugar phosphate isomerase/epimerase family protein [Sinisalibacter aestuarii]|uniref:Xylose isomerase n=1 Tax=Sinisalibacter aestuarii TaxID=2949426 RepID=A0ABQ5LR23_9RHOB|nr:sugar phosphate isomerase/epimerase [Sinisalibacter aestuarii]GKY86721.1 xylose isomerase [Sinisalibacter aestuarii]
MPEISYQLYSSRRHPLDDTLEMLADLGFEYVEGCDPQLATPDETRALLDKHGLAMPTAHASLDRIESSPDRVIAAAKLLGVETVIAPWLAPQDRPADRAGWQEIARRLAQAGAPIRAAGLGFAWHNHDYEFTLTADGCLPIEEIAAAPGVDLELDLGWIHAAGHDPADWVRRLSGKIVAAHLKDRAAPGENAEEEGWADLGSGTVNYNRVLPALKEADVEHWVLEHDAPTDDERFATRSFMTAAVFAF